MDQQEKELLQKIDDLDRQTDGLRHQLGIVKRNKAIIAIQRTLKTHNFPHRVAVKPYKPNSVFDPMISLEVYDGHEVANKLQELLRAAIKGHDIKVYSCDSVEIIYDPTSIEI